MDNLDNNFLTRRREQLAGENATGEKERREQKARQKRLLDQPEAEGFSNFDPYERGRNIESLHARLNPDSSLVIEKLTGKDVLVYKPDGGKYVVCQTEPGGSEAYYFIDHSLLEAEEKSPEANLEKQDE